MAENLVIGPFWPLFAQIWAPTYFFENRASPLHRSELHAKKLRKPIAGSIRIFVTDGLTDGRTRPILEDTKCVQKQFFGRD